MSRSAHIISAGGTCLNTMLILGIIVAVLVVGAGAAIIYYYNPATTNIGSSTETTTSQTETTTQQQTTTTTTAVNGELDLSGTWEGTFDAQKWRGTGGTGRWVWIIHKTGPNKYAGVLKTMDVYPTGGYIDIQVTVDGNKITIGTVGNYAGMSAVVFTGTISSDGAQASGTWRFSDNSDSGGWSGRKVSSSTQIPVETTTTTTQSITETYTTTEAPACTPNPPTQYQAAFQSMYQAALTVFGESNIKCYTQGMLGGIQYYVTFNLLNYNEQNINDYVEQLNAILTNDGWFIQTSVSSGQEFHIRGYYNTTINGVSVQLLGLLTVTVDQDGSAYLAIQIQLATP